MKKIFTEDLVLYKEGTYKGRINWKASIGADVRFIYNDQTGTVKIIDYKDRKITLQYNKIIKTIPEQSFKKGNIGGILGKRHIGHKFKEQDIINNFKIIKPIYIHDGKCNYKAYEYQCTLCNHIGTKYERDLDKLCPVCQVKIGNKVDPMINSIKVTDPDIYNLIIDDGVEFYARKSEHKVHWKCPNCQKINYTSLGHLTENKRLPCKYCSDGTSFPEKILNNVMSQISKTFEPQKTFEWTNRKYDIYDQGIYIEINGQQHYKKGFDKCGGRTVQEEQENDYHKKQIAIENDANYKDYIYIRADVSDFNYIKNNILDSNMKKYYNMQVINWEEVKKNGLKSDIVEAIRLYNQGLSIQAIARELKKCKNTIKNYLQKASVLDIKK